MRSSPNFAGPITIYWLILAGAVPANKELLAGTDPANKELLAGPKDSPGYITLYQSSGWNRNNIAKKKAMKRNNCYQNLSPGLMEKAKTSSRRL